VLGDEWERSQKKDGTKKLAVGVDEDSVAKGLLLLADQHRLILRVFNRCLMESSTVLMPYSQSRNGR
jgi:hypothetical protein